MGSSVGTDYRASVAAVIITAIIAAGIAVVIVNNQLSVLGDGEGQVFVAVLSIAKLRQYSYLR